MIPLGPLRTQKRQKNILLAPPPLVFPGFAGEHVASVGGHPLRPMRKSANDNVDRSPRPRPAKTRFHWTRSYSYTAVIVCLPFVHEILSGTGKPVHVPDILVVRIFRRRAVQHVANAAGAETQDVIASIRVIHAHKIQSHRVDIRSVARHLHGSAEGEISEIPWMILRTQ